MHSDFFVYEGVGLLITSLQQLAQCLQETRK